MKYRIILWGLGKIYNRMFNVLQYFEAKGEIEIVALTADRVPEIAFLDGYPVRPKEELKNLSYDLVVIMNDIHEKEIYKEAVNAGIPIHKLLFYRVLELPHFQFEQYMQMKESRISIISNNCWGGIIYHTLGMECLSPFKNLFLEDADYIKLLKNLKYYLSCELQFREFAVDVHSKERYPVMSLGDVLVHCNHTKEPEEAVENWNRRAGKVNWDNIFVEMYTEDPHVAQQFSELDSYEKKICFVPFEEKNECFMQLKTMGNEREFYEVVNHNAGNGNGCLTYFPWKLLMGEKTRRYDPED